MWGPEETGDSTTRRAEGSLPRARSKRAVINVQEVGPGGARRREPSVKGGVESSSRPTWSSDVALLKVGAERTAPRKPGGVATRRERIVQGRAAESTKQCIVKLKFCVVGVRGRSE